VKLGSGTAHPAARVRVCDTPTRISRRLAAGVIKEYPDGRREAVALNAPGDERVLRTLPPLPREPA